MRRAGAGAGAAVDIFCVFACYCLVCLIHAEAVERILMKALHAVLSCDDGGVDSGCGFVNGQKASDWTLFSQVS
jgi:hypothetical protein